jgi:pyruvate carboxylase subunit B
MIPWSPMPGGALTANTQMMRDNNIMDRYPEVIRAMGEVVRRGGFGTSVTPVSQFYFQQAFNNVMFGAWKKFAEGYGKMVLGYFGKTPVPPDPEIVALAAKDLGMEPTTRPPLELNDANPKKGIAAAKKALDDAKVPISDENIFIAATCGEKGIAFLKGEATVNVRKVQPEQPATAPAAAPAGYTVTVNGKDYAVMLDGSKATVNGQTYSIDVRDRAEGATAPAGAVGAAVGLAVEAPMPGAVMRLSVSEGSSVKAGDVLVMLEAMKMEVEVKAPQGGTIVSISVAPGDQVKPGDPLVYLN